MKENAEGESEPEHKPEKPVEKSGEPDDSFTEKVSEIGDEKLLSKTPDEVHVDTVFEGTLEDNDSSVIKVEDGPNKKKLVASLSHPDKRIGRNESDIFSLKTEPTVATSIFSVNGSPSRRVFHRRERTPNNVFPVGGNEEPPSDKLASPRRLTKENYNDEKRPSSSYRNPLTGSGLNSNDEYKSKGIKRKDGNPLLGLGYTEIQNAASSQRIPPGGFSHRLW